MAVLNIDTEGVRDIASMISNQADELETEIKRIKENQEKLNSCWTGEAATAAQGALDEVVSLYNDMLATVRSTHTSLASAANSFSDTDTSNAGMFK